MWNSASEEEKPLISHPFFLSTSIIANCSCVVAVVSQAFAVSQIGREVVGTLWLAILLQLTVNFGMLYALFSNSVHSLRLQIVVFSAMSVVLAALGIDKNIFSGQKSRDSIAAAWIILVIIDLLWILVLSPADQNSPMLRVFTKEARIRLSSDSRLPLKHIYESPIESTSDRIREVSSNPRSTIISATSTTPRTPISVATARPPVVDAHQDPLPDRRSIKSELVVPPSAPTSSAPSSNYSYTQKALALYDCKCHDAFGELSFLKGDILHVSRTFEKKWWPARKANGQAGESGIAVVPSNYLKIIQG
ncbi:hypothetical protein D9757_003030 [Collybiopsis confluens]|uniref:SH3 domain-containing protein n=1 Tax=Collybiopsis confluens TaxID=2823264 RepID=A0A8H5HXZ5_9AGAR|nr:hypothetical protein D9757_003030 [Collybiopsis confluens]